tara:strand:- start:1953 stop:2609 length:657 start_codon:yes stop_codon:yes gene_type:complete
MVAEQYPNIPGIPDKSELRLHHPYGVDSELLRAFDKEQVDLAFNQALPKLLKFVDAFAVYNDNDLGHANLDVSKFDNAPNMQFNYHADLFNDSDKYTVRLDGAIVLEMTISAGKREYSIPTGRYLSKVDFYKECKTTGEKVIDLINQLPRWIQLQKNYLKQKFIPVSLKPFAEILSVDIEEPNKKELNECPECYEYKPDDARVEKGMKCSECAYPGGA